MNIQDLVELPTVPPANQPTAVEFLSPSQIANYTPPPGLVLVGENHIVRGAVFVIAGAPGVGKSRAGIALAVAGATGATWFGLRVHRKFKTLVIQNENGRLRLKSEFGDLPCEELDEWVKVSPPPPFGIAFGNPGFIDVVKTIIAEWKPDVVIIDPWNAVARDDKAVDYLATFQAIRAVIPSGDDGPAIGIVAHTRKPKNEERANGRELSNLIAGSYVLVSVPRCVFVIQAASSDPEDQRVVFTCSKNNDGPLGQPSAWTRGNGIFQPVDDFNWSEFQSGSAPRSNRASVSREDMAAIFKDGAAIERNRATQLLMERTDCARATAYNALNPSGRFSGNLTETDGLLYWRE